VFPIYRDSVANSARMQRELRAGRGAQRKNHYRILGTNLQPTLCTVRSTLFARGGGCPSVSLPFEFRTLFY